MKFSIKKAIFSGLLAVGVLAASLAAALPAAAGPNPSSLSIAPQSIVNGATNVVIPVLLSTSLSDSAAGVTPVTYGIAGAQTTISFDPTKIHVNSVSFWATINGNGDVVGLFGGSQYNVLPTIDNVNGTISNMTSTTGGAAAIAMNGTWAKINVNVLVPDTTTTLVFHTVNGKYAIDKNNIIIPVDTTNGVITIGSGGPAETLTANLVSASGAENTPIIVTLNAVDSWGNPITYSTTSTPASGTLGAVGGNQVTYTPNPNFNGTDSFIYQAVSGSLTSSNTVNVTVTWVNQAPIATAQSGLTVPENGAVATSLPITLSSTDVDNTVATTHPQTPTYTIVTQPANGAVVLVGAVATYTPTKFYSGSDSFTFKANDGSADSAPATISITVTPVNQAPVATAQTLQTVKNTAINITLSGTDQENSPLTYKIVLPFSTSLGTLSGYNTSTGAVTGGTGNVVTFTPGTDMTGIVTFSFKANDGTVDSAPATVTVNIVSNAVIIIGTRPTYITFTAPIGSILWAFDMHNHTQDYSDTSKNMSVDANTPWTVQVSAQNDGAINGHMTAFRTSDSVYGSLFLTDPLHIVASTGPNGQDVPLSLSNQTLASASLSNFETLGTYSLLYNLTFSQHIHYIDSGLPAGFIYHVVAQFSSTAAY